MSMEEHDIDDAIREKLEILYSSSDIAQNVQHLRQMWTDFSEDELNVDMISMFKFTGGNEDRFRIFYLLTQHEYSVTDLQDIIQMSQPTISRHLKFLEQGNLIKAVKRGKKTYYKPLKASITQIEKFMKSWINSIDNWFGDSTFEI